LLVSGKFNVNNHAHLIQGSSNLTEWFYWFFSNRDITNYLTRQGAGRFKLSKAALIQLPCALPSPLEQRAITTALSDVDALLAAQEKLIAKKRDIKQAAMQQLLTGKQRLPGFSEKWEVMRMKSLGNTYGGLTGKTKVDFGHGRAQYIPFMNVMTDTVIDVDWLELVDVSSNEVQNLTQKGDLFFNGSSETPEEVGFCSVLLQDVPNLYLNSFCFGFRFNSDAKVNGLFFAYWFRSVKGREKMAVLAQGATRYNIAKSAFLKLELPQPPEEEQAAIATVLSDMDADLAALEQQRDKTRALKQGMMQALLTGRIRLV
ncbi:MAG: restriction endonuclease subunit S, partial [Gallionella sp.]